MATYKFAGYPSAKVYDADDNQIAHVLWGDWVRIDGAEDSGRYPVHVRGKDGYMRADDLQDDRLLEIVFLDVGQGDGCLVVTPDDKKIVVDAGQRDNMYRYLKWRFNFLGGVRRLDAAILTHPDSDHYAGFAELFSEPNLRFRHVLHNGIMEQKGAGGGLGEREKDATNGLWYLHDLMRTKAELEDFLAEPARYGSMRYANLLKDALTEAEDVRMVHAPADPEGRTFLPEAVFGKHVEARVLGPVIEPGPNGEPRLRCFGDTPGSKGFDKGKTKNGHSVVLMLEYRDVRILLGGDLNSPAEAFLLEHYTGLPWPPQDGSAETTLAEAARRTFGADIAKACHHGSADFTDAFLRAVHPAAMVVSSGDEESHAHPRCDTLGAVGRHGRGWRPLVFCTELNRSTREDEGGLPDELREILVKMDGLTALDELQALRRDRDAVVDELAKRNVTVYGAIQLRTDGEKVVMAYRLEKDRTGASQGRKTVTAWDIYRLERQGNGPVTYVRP